MFMKKETYLKLEKELQNKIEQRLALEKNYRKVDIRFMVTSTKQVVFEYDDGSALLDGKYLVELNENSNGAFICKSKEFPEIIEMGLTKSEVMLNIAPRIQTALNNKEEK